MSKIITAAQAAALVKDGCTLTTTGFNGFGCPEDLIMSLAAHYDQTGHPKDVTLVKCTSQGDGQGRGVSHLAERPGMFKELILSHMGYDPGLRKLVQEERVACFMLPLGNLMQLFRAIAGGLPEPLLPRDWGPLPTREMAAARPTNGPGTPGKRWFLWWNWAAKSACFIRPSPLMSALFGRPMGMRRATCPFRTRP